MPDLSSNKTMATEAYLTQEQEKVLAKEFFGEEENALTKELKDVEDNYINNEEISEKVVQANEQAKGLGKQSEKIVNKMPEKMKNQTSYSYELSCKNMVNFGGYNRAQRRQMKKGYKLKTMANANFLATVIRQQNDKAKEKEEAKKLGKLDEKPEIVGVKLNEEFKKQLDAGNVM